MVLYILYVLYTMCLFFLLKIVEHAQSTSASLSPGERSGLSRWEPDD